MATSGSRDFITTRNSIIKAALRKVGAVSQGNEPTAEQMNEAAEALNVFVLSLQSRKVFLWTVEDEYLPLVSGSYSYNLSSDILEVDNLFFRRDNSDFILESITRDEYKSLQSKKQSGDPTKYYLDKQLANPILHLWPVPKNSTSIVVGTDSNNYLCIKSHTSSSDSKPITGSNWSTYWELTTKSGVTWADSVPYYSDVLYYSKVLRLQDFDAEGDNPDFPVRWYKALIYGLAFELSHEYGLQLDERNELLNIFEREFEFAKGDDSESSDLMIGVRRQ